jgi:NAD(P)-dependent dehydrogenase (short-subunit alcohol dehydrogenase family)
LQELEGRVAVVTGGGSGIGEALVRACADAGMSVVVADIHAERAEQVAADVAATGARALAAPCDVGDPASVTALAERTYDELGACHLLCNNAGVLVLGDAQTRSQGDWDWALRVNVRGAVNGVAAFVPRMRAQGGEAHVMNTASMDGLQARPGSAVYITSKYALVGYSECLRLDLEPHGIGVTTFCPAHTATPMFQHALQERPPEFGSTHFDPEDIARGVAVLDGIEERTFEAWKIAELALDGVRRNAPYVICHHEYRALLEARMQALEEALLRAEQLAPRGAPGAVRD